jgi:cold shock CspA family protein
MVETGIITAINSQGFGFIAADRHAGKIWIRPRSSKEHSRLHEGQRVEYTIKVGELGIEAANVRPIGS